MASLSKSDEQLLEHVRKGDPAAWQQLITEYHGRLLMFARRQLPQSADADDAVQEMFLSLIKSLENFRGETTLETWLFQLLRRRIVDHFRKAGRTPELKASSITIDTDRGLELQSENMTGSIYARRAEERQGVLGSLTRAVGEVAERLKAQKKFRDLMVFDLLFFAGWKNQQIADEVGLQEAAVALLKHRLIRRLSDCVTTPDAEASPSGELLPGELLAEVWERSRPGCPKRTTLGKYLLGTLDTDWDEYVSFHNDRVGCHYCAASLTDLSNDLAAGEQEDAEALQHRILESTVGFLNQPIDHK